MAVQAALVGDLVLAARKDGVYQRLLHQDLHDMAVWSLGTTSNEFFLSGNCA
jgi:hypothetical protein